MTIPFISQVISGLATQAYNSGAVNRKFVNDVSGAVWTKFDSLSTFDHDLYMTSANSISRFVGSSAFDTWRSSVDQTEMSYLDGVTSDIQDQLDAKDSLGDISWTTPTAGAGISLDSTTGMVSGALTIEVDSDSITQAMLKSGAVYRAAALSAQRVDSIYTSTEKTKLGTIEDSADVTDASNVNIALGAQTISSNAKSAYDWFVASSQKLSDHNSGWASVPTDNPISHSLSAIPSNVLVTPSGLLTLHMQ